MEEEILDNKDILDALFSDSPNIEDLKEPDTIIPSVGDKPLEEKDLATDGELVSSHNSANVLPDELGTSEVTPISKKNTTGIHDGDSTDNDKPISSHNSKKFL